MSHKNFTMFDNKSLYIRKVRCDLTQSLPDYAYCVLDIDRKNMKDSKFAKKMVKNGLTDGEAFNAIMTPGFHLHLQYRLGELRGAPKLAY